MDLNHFRKNLRQLERIVEEQGNVGASCCGVTLSQCHVILEIGEKGDMTISDLTDRLGLDKSTLSRTVNELVSQEVVERRPNPDDRRFVLLRLTEKGKEIFMGINETCNKGYRQIFELIPKEKHNQIVESFSLFVEAVMELKQDGSGKFGGCCNT